MWLLLTLWVIWNLRRYGQRNRRTVLPPHVTNAQMAEAMRLSPESLRRVNASRVTYMHFDSQEYPVIEKTVPGT
jgi:hypothetical protein